MIDLGKIFKIAEAAAEAAGKEVRERLKIDEMPNGKVDPERLEAGVEALVMTAVVFLAGLYPALPPDQVDTVLAYIVAQSKKLHQAFNPAVPKAQPKLITPILKEHPDA